MNPVYLCLVLHYDVASVKIFCFFLLPFLFTTLERDYIRNMTTSGQNTLSYNRKYLEYLETVMPALKKQVVD